MLFSGVFHVDKPAGISSARVVSRVKRLLPKGTKIGHAGTLDPFATGVLVLLVGKGTKLCEALMGSRKRYWARVKLGATTLTGDPESAESPRNVAAEPSEQVVRERLTGFIGDIQQVPPIFSAMKVGGRRAYDLARRGETVSLAGRIVRVYGIEVLSYRYPDLELVIDCGRGTYIRSIARDLGEALETGGYLSALRRTRVGPFDVSDAASLEELTAESLPGRIRTVERVLEQLAQEQAR